MRHLLDESTPATKAHGAYVWARHSLNQAATLLLSLRALGTTGSELDAAEVAFDEEKAEYAKAVDDALAAGVWMRRRRGDK